MSSLYVSRINQLDALQLDTEIHRIFTDRTHEILHLFTPGLTENWSAELTASLRALIWAFSLGSGNSTFGQKLLDLSYENLTRKKSLIILFFSVVPRYLGDKYLDPHIVSPRDGRLKKNLEKIIGLFSLLNFINLLLFLNRGKQPTILEKFLGISSSNIARSRPRTIGYSYMTRELLWHGLMELFSIGLPMINFHYLKRFFITNFGRSRGGTLDLEMRAKMTQRSLCPYCQETPILPHTAGCTHIYCYYCLAGLFQVSESFDCDTCSRKLHLRDMRAYSEESR